MIYPEFWPILLYLYVLVCILGEVIETVEAG